MCGETFFNFFFGGVRANAKLSRKTLSKHRGVIYQTNQKRALYNTGHSLGVLGRVMDHLTINHYQVSFSQKKCYKSTLRRIGVNLNLVGTLFRKPVFSTLVDTHFRKKRNFENVRHRFQFFEAASLLHIQQTLLSRA